MRGTSRNISGQASLLQLTTAFGGSCLGTASVGVVRFERTTSSSRTKRAGQAALHPDVLRGEDPIRTDDTPVAGRVLYQAELHPHCHTSGSRQWPPRSRCPLPMPKNTTQVEPT